MNIYSFFFEESTFSRIWRIVITRIAFHKCKYLSLNRFCKYKFGCNIRILIAKTIQMLLQKKIKLVFRALTTLSLLRWDVYVYDNSIITVLHHSEPNTVLRISNTKQQRHDVLEACCCGCSTRETVRGP